MGKSTDYTLYKPETPDDNDVKASFWRSRKDAPAGGFTPPPPEPDEQQDNEHIPLVKDLLADLQPPVKETSVITADTVITGNIKTGSNLAIQGRVEGDIDCGSSLSVSGSVLGNIRASSVKLEGSTVEGNISSDNSIVILAQGQVTGNLAAADVDNHGKVVGDISAAGSIQMRSTSVLNGNLTAGSIHVESGAIIRGQVEVSGKDKF